VSFGSVNEQIDSGKDLFILTQYFN